MTEAGTEPIIVAGQGHVSFVQQFLRRYPEVAAALRARGAYVVVFSPDRYVDELDDEPTPEGVARRTRLALEEAERAVPPGPGVPVFVAANWGCYFSLALLPADVLCWYRGKDLPREEPPLRGLRPSHGILAGYVEMGEGGATFYAPDGRQGTWELARETVMGELGGDAAS
jgi:hypothetical protein